MRYVESLNRALHELMEEDPNVFIIGQDLLDPYGGAFKVTRGLSTRFPQRVLTSPISEAAIVGFATGLALRGLRPIVEIMFGDFLTLCADQIVNGATKFHAMYNRQVDVPLVIRTPMGGRRGYGPTHSQTLESMFFNVPGLTIVAPSQLHDPGFILKNLVRKSRSPVLFVESKTLYPMALLDVTAVESSKPFVWTTEQLGVDGSPTVSGMLQVNRSPDIAVLTYGGMTPLVLEAAYQVFVEEEVLVRVVVPSQIKPPPWRVLEEVTMQTGRVLVVEEGGREAGWSSYVAAHLQETCFRHLRGGIQRIGALPFPVPSAIPLENRVLPQIQDIVAGIYRCLGMNRG